MKCRIAVLSACGLSCAHVSRLRSIGEVVQFDKTQGQAEAIKRLQGANIAVADCSDIEFTERLFASLPSLAYLCLASTGYEQVDLEAAHAHGVTVANVPCYATDSVAEHTIALMFSLIRHIPRADRAMRDCPFEVELGDWRHNHYLGHNIRGKMLGIIGLGRIGIRVAELGRALGMIVSVCSARDSRSTRVVAGIETTNLETVLRHSDVISINAAYHQELKHLIGPRTIPMLKASAVIVNTSRGALVDEAALATALSLRGIAGYATDVLEDTSPTNPLLLLPNVVLTPHVGFYSEESVRQLADSIVANVESYAMGHPVNQIR